MKQNTSKTSGIHKYKPDQLIAVDGHIFRIYKHGYMQYNPCQMCDARNSSICSIDCLERIPINCVLKLVTKHKG